MRYEVADRPLYEPSQNPLADLPDVVDLVQLAYVVQVGVVLEQDVLLQICDRLNQSLARKGGLAVLGVVQVLVVDGADEHREKGEYAVEEHHVPAVEDTLRRVAAEKRK